MVFWQSPNTRKQARPQAAVPTARANGTDADLTIVVDAHERYPYRFEGQQVQTVRRALRCGDYAVELDGQVVAAVERKSLTDLVSSLTKGTLRSAVAELTSLPRAAVVVEDRYSHVFQQEWVRPAVVLDGLAELQVRYPGVPLVFSETRKLAQEWTYRFLAAASVWLAQERASGSRSEARAASGFEGSVTPPTVPVAQVRTWARTQGLRVADRGRLRSEIIQAWRDAQADHGSADC